MFPIPLNAEGLPYPDPLHPIAVHFVIAMVLFSFVCDTIGVFTHNRRLFEVSWWNLFVAALAVFVAILLGQFEAAIAPMYAAAQPVLNIHTLTGWILGGAIIAVTGLRYAIRRRHPHAIPVLYLGFSSALTCLVLFQTYLGSQLFWVYGLHVQPVVEAIRAGALR